MSRALKNFEASLESTNILSRFPDEPRIDLHSRGFGDLDAPPITMLGPCWMDDLAIPLTAINNEELFQNLQVATSTILDTLRAHAMTPNLGKGKTEILFKPRGTGKQKWHRYLFGPLAPGYVTALGEYDIYKVNLVHSYLHLGGFTHFSGDLRKEIRRRISIAHQSFNKYRKLIFQNEAISMSRRAEIFSSLILSRLLYGAETWTMQDAKTKECLHSAIIKLYKRLLRCPADDHIMDEEVLHRLAMPSPGTLLRVKRLSYVSSLLNHGPSAHWGLLNQDQTWLDLVRDDLQWMGDQLANSSNLGNPFEHTDRWLEIMQFHRGYWKRLIRRAREHSILLNSRSFLCASAHIRVRTMLQDHHFWTASTTCPSRSSPSTFFGCMFCGLRFKTLAGEGAHMNRTHGKVHPVRTLMDGTQCGACLKEYFTYSKLKHHLIRADSCRRQLIGRKLRVVPEPGEGSTSNAALHHSWDGRLPPLQAAGPLPQEVCPRDFEPEHTELFEAISLMIVDAEESELNHFGWGVRRVIEGFPISWTDCCKTLRCIQNLLLQADLHLNGKVKNTIHQELERICDPETWQFLRDPLSAPVSTPKLCEIEKEFEETDLHFPQTAVPRPCSQERIFLHFFSGRRRAGDLQFYMEQLFDQLCPDGTLLCVVSVDLVINQQWGNVRLKATQDFWLQGVRAGWVCGALCGPPCETWSQARHVPDVRRPERGPRPLRDRDNLWGYESLSLREAQQVATGNELLLFSFEILYALACIAGFGVLEHPKEPEDLEKPSIWRLAILKLLQQFPGVDIIDLSQGLWGAHSPKPTRLLTLNLPSLRGILRAHQVTSDPPRRSAIGKAEDGSWRTAPLKEYPPALNRALATAFCQWFHLHPCTDLVMDPGFLEKCRAMDCRTFGTHFGPDYGG